ncbi:aminotransferase class V-fold PLP-dependent enzyme [Membranihabitans maritimus]|uniref:aminotransferase class V-fold PLP-dependent enzyme n=1 Tax=Membranihabitans maritimus TaxID=2904244 RepID=UPI001F33BDF7|nr:aminotransferase class V-fold PLP-dependent enzyme [Membranihabitans maritimus]
MISSQQHLFNLPAGETYLNAAYMTPLAKEVEVAGIQGLRTKCRPGSITPEHFFQTAENVRKAFSLLINNPDPQRIAILPSVSYGMANVIKNINNGRGNEVVVVEDQFPSAVFPWQNKNFHFDLHRIKLPDLYKDRGPKLTREIINSIRQQTAAVCIGVLHWTDGTLYNLKEIAEACKKHHALFIIDGTQSIGALPFDISELWPDAVFCSSYKWLMGPYGTALGYFGPVFDDGIPIEDNWINRENSGDFTNLTKYEQSYRKKAQKYNVGEYSNFTNIPMVEKGLEMILEWKVERIQEYCQYLVNTMLEGLHDSKTYWIEKDENWRANHLIGIHILDEVVRQNLVKTCIDKKIHVSFRGDCMRISPHLYNTKSDIYNLTDVLQTFNKY